MDKITLEAAPRTIVGKKVKRLRSEGQIPAVVYGYQVPSRAIQVNRRDLEHAFRQGGNSSLIDLQITGENAPIKAFIQEIHRDNAHREWLHAEFHAVNLREEVTGHIPLVLVNESPAVNKGKGVLLYGISELELRALPTSIPHHIEVDVSALTEVDQTIHVKDLTLPSGVRVITGEDELVAKVAPLAAPTAEEREAEVAAEAAQAEAEQAGEKPGS
ncbi:MAG: 50S ribosomal protein L25 [Chloroflexi bacterium]|nr:50S ribosomal protein L25 [Chloroflexota bacterium]